MKSDTDNVTLPEPAFVIEHDNKLYLTLGVLEYDPKQGGLSPEQKATIKKLKDKFKRGQKVSGALVYDWHTYAGGITKPPSPSPTPQ